MSVHSYSRYWLYLIPTQEEHHQKKSFWEEYRGLAKHYGLQWVGEETVETVGDTLSKAQAPR